MQELYARYEQSSHQDNQLMQKTKEAGRIMDIPVLDHIIFTDQGYYSFADEGQLRWYFVNLTVGEVLGLIGLSKAFKANIFVSALNFP